MAYVPLALNNSKRIENIEGAFFYSIIGFFMYFTSLRMIENVFSSGNDWIFLFVIIPIILMIIFITMAIGYTSIVANLALDRLVLYWMRKGPGIKRFLEKIGGNMGTIIKILLWIIFIICLIKYKSSIEENIWGVLAIFFPLVIYSIMKN